MRYSIGLDIGIASVGFAVMELDHEDLPSKIIRIGSRVFDVAENPKDGASLAEPRREARSMRRRLRRKSHRKARIRNLILGQNILSQDALDSLFNSIDLCIYQLRAEALDRIITNEELARILIHLSQRRGFKSNRKAEDAKKEGALLKAIAANEAIMKEKNYRTVGELFYRDEAYSKTKRNKGENYQNTITRDMIEVEARTVFLHQRDLGNTVCSESLEEEYLKILLSQRSFDEGPGKLSDGTPNPYAKGIEGMVGECTFEKDEPRAPKASYSFERFELLQKVNHIRLDIDGKTVPLTVEQRHKLIELAHSTFAPTYARIRKELTIPENARFNSIRKYENDVDAAEKAEKFNCLKNFHEMRKTLDKVSKGRIASISTEKRNEIGRIFSLYKSEDKIRDAFAATNIDIEPLDVETLINNLDSFSKFGHLSVKALDKIIPFLEEGLNYNEACEKAGYDFKGMSSDGASTLISLEKLAESTENTITSNVAKRTISQCAKVINAIIREMDRVSPVYINIELAREMSKPHKERVKDDKDNRENSAYNERIKNELSETDGLLNPKGLDIVRLKLWKQQDGRCAYSNTSIPRERLFQPGGADIDHIVPYSISFDDTYNNKVLVQVHENRQKGDRLPLQYLTGKRRDDFIVWVENSTLRKEKKDRLLKAEITEDDRNRFKERNLQDTKTISSFMYRYLSEYLEFAPSENRVRRVTAVNGRVTSMLRSRWGLNKVREDGDMHHAFDAAVIACTTQGMINRLSGYYGRRETLYTSDDGTEYTISKKTGEIKERFPQPYNNFSNELIGKLSKDVFVSRMPSRKVSGAAHKETIKGIGDDGSPIKKVPLTALKLKDGEIEGYYNPGDDRLLYDALKNRLMQFDGKADKAFEEPFYKPKSDGSKGPLVKKVKIVEKSTLNVLVHKAKGAADNDSMVRVDVFHIEGDGYYLVPIYVADTVKDVLPNKAIVAYKPYKEWKEMEEKDFLFSLYPNDLIHIKARRPMSFSKVNKESKLPEKIEKEEEFVYYKGADIATGSITVINHDNSYKTRPGTKTLSIFEKYQVDVLGNTSKVGRETRQGFRKGR
ncbi:MAG: type II CRISPR RNA-guided endonuclease Cas9 [Defluviitaleaceae bacterium]|nr:type II CRISPR RNA-guided endonuclease Cas9 [Defluviitaleaceae bacterium]